MGHHKLREDKKCQNCGFIVRRRFCPKCGQENIETRQTFFYLFTHFIEDLVHYDGSFWKTLKYLLFKPGLLTREYLEGKRKKFVAPVKLYIFVSFFVFFVGGIISKMSFKSDFDGFGINKPKKTIEITEEQRKKDSLMVAKNSESWPFGTKEKTLKEYDSIQNNLPENLKDKGMDRIISRKEIELKQKYTKYELGIKIMEVASKNIPKFLFAYMPVFAFFMWLFHSKKKWYYFDHGIFTLHYFAFLLLSYFVMFPINSNLIEIIPNSIINLVFSLINVGIFCWSILYFYKAHRKVYLFSRIKTFLTVSFLLILNMIFLLFGIIVYMFFIFYLM